jgi:hypothetical protein
MGIRHGVIQRIIAAAVISGFNAQCRVERPPE